MTESTSDLKQHKTSELILILANPEQIVDGITRNAEAMGLPLNEMQTEVLVKGFMRKLADEIDRRIPISTESVG